MNTKKIVLSFAISSFLSCGSVMANDYSGTGLINEPIAVQGTATIYECDIFFNLDDHKKQAVRSKEYSSPETAANRYYNDGVFPDKNVDHFDDDYIQVIGRKGE